MFEIIPPPSLSIKPPFLISPSLRGRKLNKPPGGLIELFIAYLYSNGVSSEA